MSVTAPERRFFPDMSTLSPTDLAERVMAQAQAASIPEVLATDKHAISPEVEELHARIQQVQSVEAYSPDAIVQKVLTGASAHYTKDPHDTVSFSSIDELITKKKEAIARTDTLNNFGLDKPDQVLLLRAIILSTTAREWESRRLGGRPFSERQANLQRKALFSLRHLATNPVHVAEIIDPSTTNRFLSAYVGNYLARSVLKELHMQSQIALTASSVDQALGIPIAFGQLVSGDQSTVYPVFPPGTGPESDPDAETRGFKPVFPIDDPDRLHRLRQLQFTFGGPLTEFRYFESIQAFKKNPETDVEPKPGKGTGGEKPGSDEDEATKDDSFYLVLEIINPDDRGNRRSHVVADHPEVNNACFALRDEVLDEWERLLGIRMTWMDVFTLPRKTARQLGARAFHHNKGSDVEGRVRHYLNEDPHALVLDTFGRLFNSDAGLFDDAMQPTEKNRMPQILIERIQHSKLLRDMWPGIRQFGYSAMHRDAEAAERVKDAPRQLRERQVDMTVLARQIFAAIIREES